MVFRLRELEEAVRRLEEAPDADAEELARADRKRRIATERVFVRLERVHGESVVLDLGESDLPISTPEGRLFFAAARGLTHAARDLVAGGAVGVNAPVSWGGAMATGVAARFGHVRCLRELIRLGGSVHPRFARDRLGMGVMSQPLSGACVSLNLDVLQTLLDAGADAGDRCEIQWCFCGTALLAATLLGFVGGVRLLLQQPGIDVHARGKWPNHEKMMGSPGTFSALDVAIRNPVMNSEGDMEAIRELLRRKIRGDEPEASSRRNAEAVQGAQGQADEDAEHELREIMFTRLRRLKAAAERAECSGDPTALRMLTELRREILRVFSICEGQAVIDTETDTHTTDTDGPPRGERRRRRAVDDRRHALVLTLHDRRLGDRTGEVVLMMAEVEMHLV